MNSSFIIENGCEYCEYFDGCNEKDLVECPYPDYEDGYIEVL